MCRRLLEMLIIEVYEWRNQSAQLRGADGNLHMLNGLIGVVERDQSLGLSRNGLKGLKDFKSLGDLSAHNRRFNAQASDVDRVRSGLRIAVEELLHLSNLHNDTVTVDHQRAS